MIKQILPNREPARGTHRRKSVRVLFAVSVLALVCGLQARLTGVFSYTRVRVGRLRVGMAVATVAMVALSAVSVGLWVQPETAVAAPANTINFQARLQSASGSIAADGFYNVRFKLYNTSSGGSALWTETYLVSGSNGIRTANGYLTSNLGSLTAFPSSINWGQQLYLTMEVGGTGSSPAWDGEMSPRLSMTSVPSAFALNSYNGANGFSSSLSILQPTGGNQIFQIQDQGAAGTYNVCIANSSSCGFAASSGNGNYIQNQNSAAQSASNFWISGTGKAATALQAPSFDSIAAGNLNIGTTNATSITLGKSGVNTIVAGNLSIGTTSSYGAVTLANGAWLTALDNAGTGAINVLSVNANNEIQVGAALNIDGGIVLPTDGGQMTLSDLPISSSAVAGTAQSYTLRVGSSNVLTVYGEADGAGNAQNLRVAIGSSITPAYTLDVGGNARFTGRVIGADAVGSNEFATLSQVSSVVGGGSGNGNYIQNQNSAAQSGANFWVSGTGKAAGGLLAPSVDTIAAGALGIGGTTATSVTIGKVGVATTIGGSLSVSGTAAFDSTVQIAGDLQAGNQWVRSVSRSVPIVVNDAVDIGSFAFANGASNLGIEIAVPSGGFSVAKSYIVPVGYAETAGAWQTVAPLSDSGTYAGQDFALDVNVTNGTVSLRIRRVTGATVGTAYVTITQQGNPVGTTFTPSSATASVTAPTATYSATALTQVNGNVGIGTTNPGAKLEVVTGTAATVGQIIRATASQTANLFEVRSSGNGLLARFDANGNLGVVQISHPSVSGNYLAFPASAGGAPTFFTGAAGNTGLYITGFTAQTADLLQLRNSSNVALAKFDAAGLLTTPGATINGAATVNGALNVSLPNATTNAMQALVTNTTAVTIAGVQGQVLDTSTTDQAGIIRTGVVGVVRKVGTSAWTGTNTGTRYIQGVLGQFTLEGGSVDAVVGVRARNITSTGTSSTDVIDFYARSNALAGTHTNHYGLYVATPDSVTGTLTNNYGVYIGNQTGGTNNYGLGFAAGTTPSAGITWGTDTNLYRSAANILKTDDMLIVGGTGGLDVQGGNINTVGDLQTGGVTRISSTGAGALTTLSLSGVLTSTVATGTAPFTVASSTKVTNLNADTLDGLDSSAFCQGSCLAGGSASGDLTGTFPNPTIAKLQGSTLSLNTPVSGNILQFNGTAWVNQTVTGDISISSTGVAAIAAGSVVNADLAGGAFTNITGVGTLTGLTVNGSILPSGHLNGSQNLGAVGNYWGSVYANELEIYNAGNVGLSTSGTDLNIGAGKLYVKQSNGSVGIGTTAPVTALDVVGSISSRQNNLRTYNSVYSSYTSSASTTGTLKITLPNGWTNTMLKFTISGYDYSANAAWTAVVSGYNYSSANWINNSAEVRGTPAPFSSIRLGYDSVAGKTVLLLGTTSSTWSYPQFSITEVIAGHSNQDIWGSGYSSAFITSEADITNIAAPVTQQVAYGQVFLQGGSSYGANAVLGTNDNYALTLETNNTARLSIDTSGNVNILTGGLQVGNTTVISSGRVLQNVTYNGGTIGVGYGGTGQTSFTQYGILFGNNTGALGVTGQGTTGQCLTATTGGAPSWGVCANGSGSGVTLQAAYNNSLGGTTPEIVLDASKTTLDVQAYSGQTADLFVARAYSATGLGVARFSVSAAGAVTTAGSMTIQSGGANITGGVNNNSGGITNSGSLTGVSGITTTGGYTQSGTTANVLTGATTINSTLTVQGSGTFGGNLVTNGQSLQGTIVDTSATNLIANGSFEATITGWASNATTMARTTDDAHFGNASMSAVYVGSGDGYLIYNLPTMPKTLADRSFTYSFWAKASIAGATTSSSFIQPMSPTGTICSLGTISLTTSWQRYQTTCTVPSGTTNTTWRAVIRPSSNPSATMYIDGVSVQSGTSGTDYTPYATTELGAVISDGLTVVGSGGSITDMVVTGRIRVGSDGAGLGGVYVDNTNAKFMGANGSTIGLYNGSWILNVSTTGTSVTGTLGVSGATTLASLSVTNSATIGGTLALNAASQTVTNNKLVVSGVAYSSNQNGGISVVSGTTTQNWETYFNLASDSTGVPRTAIGFNVRNMSNVLTSSVEAISVLSGGSVGIGTTTPSQRLDVQGGSINTSGSLMTAGTVRITSTGTLQNVSADTAILTSGTLASARLSGSYTGITTVGTLTSVTTSGTVVATGNVTGSRLISTIADGTAPLQVASSTVVEDLNADMLDGYHANDFALASENTNYIQNSTDPQEANFNISGNGVIGGELLTNGVSFGSAVGIDVNNAPWFGIGMSNKLVGNETTMAAVQVAGKNGLLFTTEEGTVALTKEGNLGVGMASPKTLLHVGITPHTVNYPAQIVYDDYECAVGDTITGTTCTHTTSYAATYISGAYSCPSGGTLSGTTCTYVYTASYSSAYYYCPSGGTISGTTCVSSYSATYNSGGYYCPSGGTISGTTCTISYTASYSAAYYDCPSGGTLNGSNQCVKSANSSTTYTCPHSQDTVSGSNCRHDRPAYGTKANCEAAGYNWSSGSCYSVHAADAWVTYSCTGGWTLYGNVCWVYGTYHADYYYCPSGGTLSGTSCNSSYAASYYSAYYSCPSGGTLSGTTCNSSYTASYSSAYYYCPSGGSLSGTTCTYVYSATVLVTPGYTCPSGGTLNSTTCYIYTTYAATPDTVVYICAPPSVNAGTDCIAPIVSALFEGRVSIGSESEIPLQFTRPSVAAGEMAFGPYATYATASTPYGVTNADFNNDGKLDLVTANYSGGSVSVLINKGNGKFMGKVDYTTGSSPWNVIAADFDGDSDIDLATVNYSPNTISILKNNGDGTFATKVDYATGSNPRDINFADVDNDNDKDIVVANYSGSSVSVYKNFGDGTFAAKVDYTVGSGVWSVALSDIDGDGDKDIVAGNYSPNTISVLKNNGDGTFATKVDYATGSNPRDVTLADFDGDGDQDIAISNYGDTTVSVFKNNGDGTFAAKSDFSNGGYSSTGALIAADFDGDGDIDLIGGRANSAAQVFIMRNNGSGTLSAFGTVTLSNGYIYSVTSGDFNQDGKPDIAIANYNNSLVNVLFNETAFPLSSTTYAATLSVNATDNNSAGLVIQGANNQQAPLFATQDASGAPLVSMSTIESGNNLLAVGARASARGLNYAKPATNAGSISFSSVTTYSTNSYPYGLATDDFDNDGDIDMVTANYQAASISVFKNNATGTFSAYTGYTTGTSPWGLTSADIDADGDKDIITANYSSNTVSVLKNNGDGTFATKVDYATASNPRYVAATDFDADGDVDLVVSNYSSSSVSVLKNNGNGTFATKVDYTVGSSPQNVVTADFDADGDMDIAVTNYSSNTFSLLKNNGNGTFATKVDTATGSSPFGLIAADFDGDGKTDLIAANYSSSTISVFKNSGTGTFTKSDYTSGMSYPTALAYGDADGDGDLDVMVTSDQYYYMYLLLNDGNGAYSTQTTYSGINYYNYGLAAADFNQDGKVDFAATSWNSYTVGVMLNNTTFPTPRATYVATMGVSAASSSTAGLIIQGAVNQSAHLFVLQDATGSNLLTVDASGNLKAKGTITGGVSSPDYAENIGVSDPSIEAADVVTMDPTHREVAIKATTPYDGSALGVISTKPGFLTNASSVDDPYAADQRPLALSGRVPVKVSTMNGVIRQGDYLTSSTMPGMAMKATGPGAVIGVAMADFTGTEEGSSVCGPSGSYLCGKVLMFINPSATNPAGQDMVMQGGSAVLSALTVNGALHADSINTGGLLSSGSLKVAGNAEIGGYLKVGGDLTVTGTTRLGKLVISKHILSDSDTPLVAIGSAAGQEGLATINGTDVAGTLNITVKARPQQDNSPAETLIAGSLAEVTFNKPYEFAPRIVISPLNPASVNVPVYLVKTNTGYKLMISQPAPDGTVYEFDYVIMGSNGQTASAGN